MKLKQQMIRQGLTLIELVMVLVILAALAALVVPQIDYLRQTSDKATSSYVLEQLAENIGLYRTMTNKYPGKLDSLMEGDGTTNSSTPLSTLLMDGKVVAAVLTAGELEQMDDMFGTVMHHDTSNAYRNFQGNSGQHEIAVGDNGQESFLVITDKDIINSVYANASTNSSGTFPNMADVAAGDGVIALSAGPDNDPATISDNPTARLVVLGVGPSNSAVGSTMVTAPAYAAVDGRQNYNRFLVMFAIYDNFTTTKRPQFKAALNSEGDFLDQELIHVTENSFDNQ